MNDYYFKPGDRVIILSNYTTQTWYKDYIGYIFIVELKLGEPVVARYDKQKNLIGFLPANKSFFTIYQPCTREDVNVGMP